MGSGQGHISWGGSSRCTGVGGVDLASFAITGPLGEGPCSTGREAGPWDRWIHRSIALGICTSQASLVRGTARLFPCAVWSNLRWWAGPQSDLMSAPSPQLGPVRLVCTLSPPLSGAGLTVEWCGPCLGYLHTARLVVLLQWDLAKGILTGVGLQGAQGWEDRKSVV